MTNAPTLRDSSEQPLHKSAQRLRWFVSAFQTQTRETEAQTGNRFALNTPAMTEAFADWIRAFDAQKPQHDQDKPAYVGFAAGLMLRSLIRSNPAQVISLKPGADTATPAYYWPEGYLYVTFCLNVRGMILEQEFDAKQHPNAALDELRTWWSFRENAREDASMAIAYLDLFAGQTPEWSMPDLFRATPSDAAQLTGSAAPTHQLTND
jgi:hypothetical protein